MMHSTVWLSPLILLYVGVAGCDQTQRLFEKEQIARAVARTGGDPERGRLLLHDYGCAGCHTIRGVRGANALVGPPLDTLGQRVYIAGVMTNTPQNLIRWIRDPPGVDPMTAMPNLQVGESDARDIASYLYAIAQ